MNNIQTVSQFPPASTIPHGKIQSSNIVRVYGYLLQVHHSPPSPIRLIFTDLTTYEGDLIPWVRSLFLDADFVNKLGQSSIFVLSLNTSQKDKLLRQLKDVYGKDLNLDAYEQLQQMGILIRLDFYVKSFKNQLEGLCIDLDIVTGLRNAPQQLTDLMQRVHELGGNKFHHVSPITRHFQLQKRKRTENILFQPLKKTVNVVQDSRFDTQQILLNLNMSSGEEEQDSLSDHEEDSFISLYTSLDYLKKLSLDEDNGKIFKISGYLIEFPRGLNEILFVEQTELTVLNNSNSLVLKIDALQTPVKTGKKLEISVMKQIANIGLIKQIEFKIV